MGTVCSIKQPTTTDSDAVHGLKSLTFRYTVVNNSGVVLMCGESIHDAGRSSASSNSIELHGFENFESTFDVPPHDETSPSEATHRKFSRGGFERGLVTIWALRNSKKSYLVVKKVVYSGTVLTFKPEHVQNASTKEQWESIIEDAMAFIAD